MSPVVARNVLIVSTVEHADDVLRAQVGEADTVKVVVPVVRQGVLDWLANDQKAFGRAEQVAERTAEQLPGETVDAARARRTSGSRSAMPSRPSQRTRSSSRFARRTRKGSSSRPRPTRRRSMPSTACPSGMS